MLGLADVLAFVNQFINALYVSRLKYSKTCLRDHSWKAVKWSQSTGGL